MKLTKGKIIAGAIVVLGGIAAWLGIDPDVLRDVAEILFGAADGMSQP